MKNYLSVVALLAFAGMASGGAILTVGNPVDYEAVGNVVEVDLTIFGLSTTLDSFQLDVDFTPGVLSALSTDPGTIDNVGGTLSGLTGQNLGLNGGAMLFRLYFNAIGFGTAFLSIPTSSVILLDAGGSEIPFATVGGHVFVDGPALYGQALHAVPEPGSLSLLLIGMVGIVALQLKRRRIPAWPAR